MSLVSSNEIPITVYEEPIVTGGDWIKHSGPSDNYINTNKVNSHKLYVESTSDNHRPITAGVARSFMGDDNVWVADMLFNSPGDKFINKHKCFNTFYSTKDACAQELSLHNEISSEFPFLKEYREGHRYEISTSRYSTLSNDDTSYDYVRVVDNAASYDINTNLMSLPNDTEIRSFYDGGEGKIYITDYYSDTREFLFIESKPGITRISVKEESINDGVTGTVTVEAPIGSTAAEISNAINNNKDIHTWATSVKDDGVVSLSEYVNTDIEYTRYSDMEDYTLVDEKVVSYIYDDAIEVIPTDEYDTSVKLRFIQFNSSNGDGNLGQPSNTNEVDIAYSQTHDVIEIYYMDTSIASDIVSKLNGFTFTQDRFAFNAIDPTKVVSPNDVNYSLSKSGPDYNSTKKGEMGTDSWFTWKLGVIINNDNFDQFGAEKMHSEATWSHYTRVVESNFIRLDGYNRIFITGDNVDRDDIISINDNFRFNDFVPNSQIGSSGGSIGKMVQDPDSSSFVNNRTDFGSSITLKEISEYKDVFSESAKYDTSLIIYTITDFSQGGVQISVEKAFDSGSRGADFKNNRYTVKLDDSDTFGDLKDLLDGVKPTEYESVTFFVPPYQVDNKPTLQLPDYEYPISEIDEEINELPRKTLIHSSDISGYDGIRYYSVIGTNGDGVFKALDRSHFEAYSSNGKLDVYYTHNRPSEYTEHKINVINNVYPQKYICTDGVMTYNNRTDYQVVSMTADDGRFIDYDINTYPETSVDGIVYGQRVGVVDYSDNTSVDFDNAPIINNFEDSDQAKVVFEVSSYWNSGGSISKKFGYDGTARGIDMYVERNRRHSALSVATPYFVNKPLDNGSLITYKKHVGSEVDITCTQGYHAEIASKLALREYNEDIIETIIVDKDAPLAGGPGGFTNFAANDRDFNTTFENIDGTYYIAYVTMDGESGSTFSDKVRYDTDTTIITHNLGTTDIIINVYNASGEFEILEDVTVLDGNRVSLEANNSLYGYTIVIISDDTIFSDDISSGISSIEHNLGTKDVQIQVYSSGKMYVPTSIRSITDNFVEVNSSVSGKVVVLSSVETGSYVETGITRPSKETIEIGHSLGSSNVVVKAYDSLNRVVVPSLIEIASENSINIEFSGAVDDHTIVVTMGVPGTDGEYSDGRRKVSGMSIDHNGDYVLYLSNFNPEQDYPEANVAECPVFVGSVTNYIKSTYRKELLRPMLKVEFGGGYLKLTGVKSGSKEITKEGLVKMTYNIETTYGVGRYRYDYSEKKSCVYYNESYIKAGSRAVQNGKVDLGSDRVAIGDVMIPITFESAIGSGTVEFNGVEYVKDMVYTTRPEGIEREGDNINIDIPTEGLGSVAIAVITSGKAWSTKDGKLLPYIGREVPCYEFEIDATELVMNNNLEYHSNISIPGRKRWLHSMIKAGYSVLVDPLEETGVSYRTQVYNNTTDLWEDFSSSHKANTGVNNEMVSSEDDGYLKYIDIISNKDNYIDSDSIINVRVYTDGISSAIDGENVWSGDIEFDYTKAGLSKGISSSYMSYFRLASV